MEPEPSGHEQPELLTLQEAADALKVHYMTAYRWVRRGDLPAYKAGGRLRVRVADVQQFIRGRAVETALPGGTGRRTDWSLHVERLHALLREGSAAQAAALTRRVVADGAPVGDVYVHLLAPALHRIGEDWASGAITVAEEHRATQIVADILSRLGERFRRRGPARGSAVTLTPAGDRHGLGAAMVAAFLRGGGYDVHHLGADVPAEDLRRFLDRVDVDVVCASVTRTDLPDAALQELADSVTGHAGVVLVVGGQGCDAERAERIGAVHLQDLTTLPEQLDAHLRR